MVLLAVSLVLAQPALPFQPLSSVSGKASGDARLVCKSNWHNLDLELTYKGTVELTPHDLKVFQPPAGLKVEDTWTIKDQQLVPLLRILHGVNWKAAQADAATYARWRGEMTQPIALQPAGSLTLAYLKSGQGYRLEFSGRIRALDVKSHSNRFGPNFQQDQWTHELLGAIVLTGDGVPFGVEIRDVFEVSGRFHSSGANPTDDNRREGTLLVVMPVTTPLSAEQVTQLKRLIGQLGDDAFAVREAAMRELLAKNSSIAPYLRQAGLTHTDAEVRQRCEWVLRKLLEE